MRGPRPANCSRQLRGLAQPRRLLLVADSALVNKANLAAADHSVSGSCPACPAPSTTRPTPWPAEGRLADPHRYRAQRAQRLAHRLPATQLPGRGVDHRNGRP